MVRVVLKSATFFLLSHKVFKTRYLFPLAPTARLACLSGRQVSRTNGIIKSKLNFLNNVSTSEKCAVKKFCSLNFVLCSPVKIFFPVISCYFPPVKKFFSMAFCLFPSVKKFFPAVFYLFSAVKIFFPAVFYHFPTVKRFCSLNFAYCSPVKTFCSLNFGLCSPVKKFCSLVFA
jgi:hypothetical protein